MEALMERLLFLFKFSLLPRQIGSITPSSMFLSRKMIEPIPWNQVRHIAELGAGTGAITKYIHRTAKKDTKVLLFEKDRQLREHLAARFPNYPCFSDASNLSSALWREGIEKLDCVVSGLPFFNFPQPLRDRLLQQIVISLRPGGWFVAFQYSQQMRKQLSQLFDIERICFVPLNIPPAYIYVCRKREAQA